MVSGTIIGREERLRIALLHRTTRALFLTKIPKVASEG
jgi:hypothetical protein